MIPRKIFLEKFLWPRIKSKVYNLFACCSIVFSAHDDGAGFNELIWLIGSGDRLVFLPTGTLLLDWSHFEFEICKETRLNLIEWSINEVISATAAPGAAGIEQHSNSNCVSDDDQQMEDMRASSLDPAFDFRVHSRIPCVLAHSNVWFSRLGTPWKQTKSGEATLYWKFKMLDHLWESKFYFVTRPLTLSYIPLSLLHTFQTSSSLKQLLLERQHFAQHSLPLRDWI